MYKVAFGTCGPVPSEEGLDIEETLLSNWPSKLILFGMKQTWHHPGQAGTVPSQQMGWLQGATGENLVQASSACVQGQGFQPAAPEWLPVLSSQL